MVEVIQSLEHPFFSFSENPNKTKASSPPMASSYSRRHHHSSGPWDARPPPLQRRRRHRPPSRALPAMIPSFDSPRVRGSYTNVHNVFSSYSNAFQTGAASIPFMAARSRLLETAVSDSNRHRYPRPRPLATHPLPHERQVCADSAIRHCRASHRDLVCNHHATTLLRSELRIAGDEAAGEGFCLLVHLSVFFVLVFYAGECENDDGGVLCL